MTRLLVACCAIGLTLTAVATSASRTTSAANGLIAYVGGSFPDSDIYVVQPDGTGRRQLTRDPEGNWCPSWSPDGQSIATTVGTEEESSVAVLRADGVQLWKIPGFSCNGWSPDGSRVLLIREDGLYLIDASGLNLRKLLVSLDEVGSWPSWSPDGTEIAFVSSYSDNSDEEWAKRLTIVVMSADGSKRRALKVKPPKWCTGATPCRLYQAYFAWAPGKDIAFVLVRGDLYPQVLYAVRPDGSWQRRLAGRFNDVYVPAWSPDGTRISFANRLRSDQIWVAKRNGTGVRQVTRITSKRRNLSGVFDHVWSPDGRQLAAIGWSGALYVVDVATGKARKVIDSAITSDGFPQQLSWQPLP